MSVEERMVECKEVELPWLFVVIAARLLPARWQTLFEGSCCIIKQDSSALCQTQVVNCLRNNQKELLLRKLNVVIFERAFMPESNFQIFNLFNIEGRINLGTTAAWSGSLTQTPGLLFGGIEVLKPRCNCVFICSAGAVNCEGKRAGIDS